VPIESRCTELMSGELSEEYGADKGEPRPGHDAIRMRGLPDDFENSGYWKQLPEFFFD
jgi:hypothetical protein